MSSGQGNSGTEGNSTLQWREPPPPKPSSIKLKRATDNAKINAILPGQLKSLTVFNDTCESTEVAEEVPESTDDDNKDTSDQNLTILSPECNEMLVSDLMKETELPNLSCNSLEMELEKLDKEDVTSDPTTATISSTYLTETAIKPQQETSPSNDKDEAYVLRESLEEAFQTIYSLDEVQLSLAEEEVRGENEDDEDAKAKCVYCEAVFKEDTSRRVWMHKTCIPKHQRPFWVLVWNFSRTILSDGKPSDYLNLYTININLN